jgi:hypothetical protein
LHFAQCPPQVLSYVVLAESKQVRHFEKRESLNLLQDENVPARLRKQKGAEHGQLERSAGILACYDAGIAVRVWFPDWPTMHDHSFTGPMAIVRLRHSPFQGITKARTKTFANELTQVSEDGSGLSFWAGERASIWLLCTTSFLGVR